MIPQRHPGVALLLVLLGGSFLGGPALGADLALTFVDVGQGDAVLVTTPGGRGWLIDGGPRSGAVTDALVNAIAAAGLDRLDGVVISHPHLDHFGGLIELVERVPVGTVYYNVDVPAPSYQALVTRLEDRQIPYQRVAPGTLDWGGALEVRVMAARSQADFDQAFRSLLAGSESSAPELAERLVAGCGDHAGGALGLDLNDFSIVLRVRRGSFVALLTGDATRVVEEELVAGGHDLSADLLKVAHHGSRHSSTLPFLEEVDPETAVIQSGTGNRYGHPHRESLRRLLGRGVTVHRNDRQGTLTIRAGLRAPTTRSTR